MQFCVARTFLGDTDRKAEKNPHTIIVFFKYKFDGCILVLYITPPPITNAQRSFVIRKKGLCMCVVYLMSLHLWWHRRH